MAMTRSRYNTLRNRLTRAAAHVASQDERQHIINVLHWKSTSGSRAAIMAADLAHVLTVARHVGDATNDEVEELLKPSFSPVCGELRLRGLVTKAMEDARTGPEVALRRALAELADVAAFFGAPEDQLKPYRVMAKGGALC